MQNRKKGQTMPERDTTGNSSLYTRARSGIGKAKFSMIQNKQPSDDQRLQCFVDAETWRKKLRTPFQPIPSLSHNGS
jgi:hypothetical protein